MENIKISCGKDSKEIGDYEREIINRIAFEYYSKIERHFNEVTSFEVYLKCFEKNGNVKRYQVDVRVNVPGYRFEASSDERDLHESLKYALEKIMAEIEHKIHISNQGKKPKVPQKNRERKS